MDLITAGVLLVIVGMTAVAVSVHSRRGGTRTEVRGGGVVMIGPIPIIFGSDARWASVAMALAIVLVLVFFLLWVVQTVEKLMAAGMLIMLAGFGLIIAGSSGRGSTSAGGVIFIGPFPIVFGTGPGGGFLALASVLIGGVMVALLLLWGWRFSRAKGEA